MRRRARREHLADAGPGSGGRSRAQAQLQMAGRLGATGTPLFVVGDRVLNGAVGYDALKRRSRTPRRRAEDGGCGGA